MAVITTLLKRPDKVWTGSELARAAKVTPRWAILTLRLLEGEGVVHPAWTPPSMRWTVNRSHILLRLLSSVAELDSKAQESLRAALVRVVADVNPEVLILFGSQARGEGAPGSDVDLLVVVKDARSKARAQASLARKAGAFFWRFGNRLAPVVLTRREFESRREYGFVHEALSEGVWLRGGAADGR